MKTLEVAFKNKTYRSSRAPSLNIETISAKKGSRITLINHLEAKSTFWVPYEVQCHKDVVWQYCWMTTHLTLVERYPQLFLSKYWKASWYEVTIYKTKQILWYLWKIYPTNKQLPLEYNHCHPWFRLRGHLDTNDNLKTGQRPLYWPALSCLDRGGRMHVFK